MVFPASSTAVFLTSAFGSDVLLVDLKSVQCQRWHLGVASMPSSFGMQRKLAPAVHLFSPFRVSNFCWPVFAAISSVEWSLMLMGTRSQFCTGRESVSCNGHLQVNHLL